MFAKRTPYLCRMNLVTGGTGMVGMHLIAALLKAGEPVRALLRTTSDTSALDRLLKHVNADTSLLERVEGDLLDVESLTSAMHGCKKVFHAAALVSFHRKDKSKLFRTNVEGTFNMVNVALETSGLEAFVYISSVAALGRNRRRDAVTEASEWKDDPDLANYARSKHMAEREVWRGSEEGLKIFMVNPSIILGIGDFERSSAEIFRQIDRGMPFYPPGSNGFVAVQDVVAACFHLLEHDLSAERYILNASHLTYGELFQKVGDAVGAKAPDAAAPRWLMRAVHLGVSLLEKISGKRAFVTREGIRNASKEFHYDARKMESTGFRFTPLDAVIRETGKYYLETKA